MIYYNLYSARAGGARPRRAPSISAGARWGSNYLKLAFVFCVFNIL